LKEKILAAKRAKLNTVILPKRNKKDLEGIPKHLLKGIHLSFADTMDDVMKIALRRTAATRSSAKQSSSPATAAPTSAHTGKRKRDSRAREIHATLSPVPAARLR
jgi:ATP-dependent Lon protease